jgi:hypothetical protein
MVVSFWLADSLRAASKVWLTCANARPGAKKQATIKSNFIIQVERFKGKLTWYQTDKGFNCFKRMSAPVSNMRSKKNSQKLICEFFQKLVKSTINYDRASRC